MALIALLSCTKSKMPYRCKAREMYSKSRWFPKAYEYVKKLGADKIFVLSALYGMVPEDKEIDYYERTLNDCTENERIEWAQRVLSDLKNEADLERDSFVIIAGKKYYEYLIPHMKNVMLPLKGRGIYYWEPMLNKFLMSTHLSHSGELKNANDTIIIEESENYCYELHKLMNTLPRIKYPINFTNLPNNGIYIMFEEGEKYDEFDRIVRVGTHRSPNRLRGRLRDHYIIENKDGSIFRKNIGRAILNKNNDSFLRIWEYNLSRTNNQEILKQANPVYQANIERFVSNYIRNNISFVVIGEIQNSRERLRLEAGIIAELNCDKDFTHSANWLGIFSPKEEIRKSGLWLVEGLEDRPLTSSEFKRIKQLTGATNNVQTILTEDVHNWSKKLSKDYKKEFEEALGDILEKAKADGREFIDVESGYLHRKVGGYPGRNHKMPLCCRVMRSFMKVKDTILYSPPSGKGATLRIRYYLNS